MKVKGIYQKSSGLFMFRQDVPSDLQQVFQKTVIKHSLGNDFAKATVLAIKHKEKYLRLFASARTSMAKQAKPRSGSQLLTDLNVPLRAHTTEEVMFDLPPALQNLLEKYDDYEYEELPPQIKEVADILKGDRAVLLSEVQSRYETERKKSGTKLPVDQFIEVNSDMDVRLIKRSHIHSYVEYLRARGNSVGTFKKRIGTIGRLLNYAKVEFDLPALGNPALRMTYEGAPPKERSSFTDEEWRMLLKLAIKEGDDKRLLLALLAVTGCRLSEISGLLVSDIDKKNQSITIKPNNLRRLKNSHSQRVIPLVHLPIWKLLITFVDGKKASEPVFPNLAGSAKSNTVSNTAVKWIKRHINSERDAHSLRHTVKQRLADVECPPDTIKSIMGWSADGMLAVYGNGDLAIDVKKKWLKKALG